jgi:outer membrane receptor protein involved in Fe transport
VPADLAEKSLRVFSVQSGFEVLFSSDAASGVRTNAIKGEFLPGEAVKKMLAGTTLYVRDERDGVFRIAATPRPKAPGAALNPGQNDRPGEAKSGARSRDPPPGSSSTAQPNQLLTSQPQHTESPPVKKLNLLSFLTGWLVAGAATDAQTAVIPSKEEVVTMSPFEVVSDNRGYYAANTTSGTRLNSKIGDLGASISVVTKEQMADFALLDLNDIFNYEAGTEGTGNFTDFSYDIYGSPVDSVQLNPQGANRIRGLGAASITLGNFETSGRVPIDPLNIESVEISRGPNSSIFGIGSGAGTVNSVPSSANLSRHRSQTSLRIDGGGGFRTSIDLNRVLKPGVLAIRGSAAFQRDAYEQKPSGIDSVRLNGMGKYRPFARTTISASYSDYRMHGNRPNATSARDGLSGWLAAGSPTWDPFNRILKINGASVPYTGNFPSQFFWDKSGNYSLVHVEQSGITFWSTGRSTLSTTPMTASAGNVLRLLAPLPDPTNTLQVQPLWGAGYAAPLTDRRIYDWTSANLAAANRVRDDIASSSVLLDQVFIDTPRHSLAFQAGWFREAGEQYQFTPLADTSQTQGVGVITVDINERRLDGTTNPNFLRPYVAAAFPTQVLSFLSRNTYRGQLVYKLDLRTEKSPLRWLGMHQVTGYAEYKDYQDTARRYADAIVSQHSWLPAGVHHLQGTGTLGGLRPSGGQITQSHYNFYLGDSVGYNVEYAPATYQLGSYPLLFGNPTTGFVREQAQLGWTTQSNSGTYTILKSRGAILQSHLLNDRVVTTFGWRHDARYSKGRAPYMLLQDGITLDPASDRWNDAGWGVGKGPTKTAGVVVKALPWLSLYSNTSDSFRPATAGSDVYRRPVPDPSSEGRDYGFMLNLFAGKLFIRWNEYRVDLKNDRNSNNPLSRLLAIDFSWRNGATVPVYQLQEKAGEWARAEAASSGQTLTAAQLDQRIAQIMQVPVEYLSEPPAGPLPVAVNQTRSQGREVEVHYNPSAFWTVKLNLTEQESIDGKVAAEVQQWLDERLVVWNSIIDPLTRRPWFTERYNGGDSAYDVLLRGTINPLKIARALEGKSRPQVRRYRANFSTSYKLAGLTEHPVLKRFTLGGALRWEDKGAIGYYGVQQLPAVITDLDVNRPVWDRAHLYVDTFASYRTRLFSNRANATFQLNARNLTEGGRLQPISANPDGSASSYRLIDPRKFILTVTFDL